MLVGALLGAICTCAYMTRAIWYCSSASRGAAAEHTPHESGPRITVPLIILAGLAVIAGLANLPDTGVLSWVPDELALRFEHYVEPTAAYFPGRVDAVVRPPRVPIWIAVVSTAVAARRRSSSPTSGTGGALGPHGITERNRLARAGYTVLENKYYLDWLYTDVIVGGIKGPIARAATGSTRT